MRNSICVSLSRLTQLLSPQQTNGDVPIWEVGLKFSAAHNHVIKAQTPKAFK